MAIFHRAFFHRSKVETTVIVPPFKFPKNVRSFRGGCPLVVGSNHMTPIQTKNTICSGEMPQNCISAFASSLILPKLEWFFMILIRLFLPLSCFCGKNWLYLKGNYYHSWSGLFNPLSPKQALPGMQKMKSFFQGFKDYRLPPFFSFFTMKPGRFRVSPVILWDDTNRPKENALHTFAWRCMKLHHPKLQWVAFFDEGSLQKLAIFSLQM